MYFSRHYFKESLRQTRGMGILFVSVAVLFTCFVPVINLIDHLKNRGDSVSLVSVSDYGGMLPYICFLFSILFMLKLFKFVFKRSSSDFYHALPFKRQTIYFTSLVTALCWYILGTGLALGAVGFVYWVDPAVLVKPSFFALNLFVCLVMMLFVSGATLVSISITGKKSIAVTISLAICFLPRAIFLIALETVEEATNLIDISAVKFFSSK